MPKYNITISKAVYLPVYHPLLEDEDIDIDFVWGGRDSGKSKFIAKRLIDKSLSQNYFRCILVKETHESIKDAQWQMLKDVAEDWKVDALFKFRVSPLSIKCANGNTFITRGMDQAQKIRGITNPSDAWVEEGNQISREGFITLLTSLRSDFGKVKLWFSFNPEPDVPDYEDFWLYQMFFKPYEDLIKAGQYNFIGEFVISVEMPDGSVQEVRLKYRSTHVTYSDNPFITPQRIAFHEMLKKTDAYYYTIFTLGLWGKLKTGSEYYPQFNKLTHAGDYPFIKGLPVHLTYDFNVVPYMTLLATQYIEDHDKIRIRFFAEYCLASPLNNTTAVTESFIDDYEKWLLYGVFYYGDASGNNRIAGKGDEVNYDDVRDALSRFIDDSSDRVSLANKPVLKRRKMIMQILAGTFYIGNKQVVIEIDNSCKKTIEDFENLKLGPNGKWKEEATAERSKIKFQKYGHCTDAAEYLITYLFDNEF